MNTTYRDIRAKLRSMAPQRAIDYIAALDLPGDEAFCIIACDVKQQSRQQVANRLFASVEYVKKRRRNGYQKIADHIKTHKVKTQQRPFSGSLLGLFCCIL